MCMRKNKTKKHYKMDNGRVVSDNQNQQMKVTPDSVVVYRIARSRNTTTGLCMAYKLGSDPGSCLLSPKSTLNLSVSIEG